MTVCCQCCLIPATDGAETRSPEAAIERGVDFLVAKQLPSGMLPQQTCWYDPAMTNCHVDYTVWSTGFSLRSLSVVSHLRLDQVKQRAAAYLLAERTPEGLWKYWTKEFPRVEPFDVVPDLDNTSIIAAALEAQGISFTDPTDTILKQHDEKGRYYLWVYPESHAIEREYDCVSDANVLAFLAHRGLEPEMLCAPLRVLMRSDINISCSAYYAHPEMLAYATARAFHSGASCLAPAVRDLRAWILGRQRADGSWGSVFPTALAVNALMYLDVSSSSPKNAVERGIAFLLASQRSDGSWPAEVYYMMNAQPKPPTRTPVILVNTGQVVEGYKVLPQPTYWASELGTTALVLEALALHQSRQADRVR